MSFPSDIQASVRAQLADCLVAVCCQRLEFLSAHRLLVPKCEVLLPSTGARGTIRGGNFSQIANVLQAGGEEGMWTFDRYQRWMDQVTDWVRPPTPAALRTQGDAGAAHSAPFRAPLKAAPARVAPASSAPRSPLGATPVPGASKPASGRPAEEVIEVPVEELDLASLAELAKKVVERKPS
jgi:twitching motility protein PilT